MEEGVPIEHKMVTRAIERAQKQVEAQNFATRKHLLEYDDVMNKQRENIYTLRRELLEGTIRVGEESDDTVDTHGYVMGLAEDLLDEITDRYIGPETDVEDWDVPAFRQEVTRVFGLAQEDFAGIDMGAKNSAEIRDAVWERIKADYGSKEALVGRDLLQRVERDIMLQVVDGQWKDHLYSLDHLKEGIGLRGYGQRDPLVEYKRESFELFQSMKARVDEDIVRHLWWLRPVLNEEAVGGEGGGASIAAPKRAAAPRPAPRRSQPLILNTPGEQPAPFPGAPRAAQPQQASPFAPKPARTGGDDAVVRTVRRDEPKVGRNDPCPCGSGKKYKKCHGAGAA
jgi:preprotein translocase subunit SecA